MSNSMSDSFMAIYLSTPSIVSSLTTDGAKSNIKCVVGASSQNTMIINNSGSQ